MYDFVKKPPARSTHTARKDQWFSTLMLVLTFIFLICAAYHFLLTHYTIPDRKPGWLSKENVEAIPHLSTPSANTQNTLEKKKHLVQTNAQPHYDFYKLLPEMTVDVSQDNADSESS